MNILGISAFYHDSAACLVQDGKIVAAAQEERFTRKRHDASYPAEAIAYCLREGGLTVKDLDFAVFYEKPFLKFERLMKSYMQYAPYGLKSFLRSMPMWIKEKLWMKEYLADELGITDMKGELLFLTHHESHAASAFFPSPFDEAAILTMDGVGEWTSSSFGVGKGNYICMNGEIRYPDSLGLLYSAFTYYTGFKVNSGEYKMMGLAPYGEPKYTDIILKELIDLKEDGSFRMNMKYFDYLVGLKMTNANFDKLFGARPRSPESPVTQREMDLARSMQDVTEEVMVRMARHVRKTTGMRNLCLAGGVALNCVGNGRILRENIFDNIWIQPAAGDAGGALGAALFAWHQYLGHPRKADGKRDTLQGSRLGPGFDEKLILEFLESRNIPFLRLSSEGVPAKVADLLAQGSVVGWFQGRMEFGPRALGSRSILGDARSPKMQETMNLKIKFRESFRPFAPSVLKERVGDYFEMDSESPYMLLVAPVKKEIRRKTTSAEDLLTGIAKLNVPRSTIPAVTHVDYSARVQTVDAVSNPLYYELLKAFEKRHDCPVVVNTSFNVRGEPLVNTPEEAYACFMRTEMDYLVLGPFLLDKNVQSASAGNDDWRVKFELD